MQEERETPLSPTSAAILERERAPNNEARMQEERETPLSPGGSAADGSPRWISAADGGLAKRGNDEEEQPGSEDEFEFTFVASDGSTIAADEIFSNGQIRPVYPVFNRNLLLSDPDPLPSPSPSPLPSAVSAAAEGEEEERSIRAPLRRLLIEEREVCSRSGSTSSSSSSAEELEGVPEDSYCVWNPRSVPPSPDRCKKSGSTGSSLRWRLRDLVGRSHSDGKEKFVFLAADEKRVHDPKGKKEKKGKKASEVDMVTAHRMMYGDGVAAAAAAAAAGGAAGGRRPYLPYRRDLVGVFANVNGISRTHHPY